MTSHDEYADRLVVLVNQVLEQNHQLTPDSDLVDDIGMSSVQIMELIEQVEDDFEISFPLNDLAEVRTVNDLVRELARLVEAG